MSERGVLWAAALALFLLLGFGNGGAAAASTLLWPDAIEYLAIAHSLVNGGGFVDPIQWTYYLQAGVPFPATALRSPVPSLLFAIPFALGYGIAAAKAMHAVLGAAVIAGLALFGRRLMGTASAVACAVLIGFSAAWHLASLMPMSDLLAIGMMLIVFASSVEVTSSACKALVCATLTLLAWETRPTLVLLTLPIVVTAAWTMGPRQIFRGHGQPLVLYVLATLAGYLALRSLTIALTGFAPYAGYGFMTEMLSPFEPLYYGKTYVGTMRYVSMHLGPILAATLARAADLYATLFASPGYGYAGWLAVPGVIYCLLAKSSAEPARLWLRRLVALSCLMFSGQTLLTYGAFDANRYPLPIAVCGALCGFAALDDIATGLCRRLRELAASNPTAMRSAAGGLARWLPIAAPIVLVGLVHHDVPPHVRTVLRRSFELTRAPARSEPAGMALMRELCPKIPPGVLVASDDPWGTHTWCGNPATMLPTDLVRKRKLQGRFLRQEQPAFIVADLTAPAAKWLSTSLHVQPVGRHGSSAVFAVLVPAASRAEWRAPPPMICAGYGPDCRRALGR